MNFQTSKVIFWYILSSFGFFFGLSAIQFHSILFESKHFVGMPFSLLMVTGSFAGILSPLVMAFALKYFKKSIHILWLLTAIAGLSLPLMPHLSSFPLLLGVYFLHTFSVWSIFPLQMSCGLDICRTQKPSLFFILRSFGTMGFLSGCLFSYFLVHSKNIEWLYNYFALGFLLSFLGLFFLNASTTQTDSQLFAISSKNKFYSKKNMLRLLVFIKDPLFLRLLIAIFFLSWANSMAIGVKGNYLINIFHLDESQVSFAWILCAGFEIPIMYFCIFLIKRYGLATVLIFSALATMVRLGLMAVTPSLPFFYAGLLLHGFYYAGVVTGIGMCIDRSYKRYRTLFQIIATLIYAGIPNSIGNFMTGIIWENFNLKTVYYASFGLAIVSLLLFYPLIPRLRKRFS